MILDHHGQPVIAQRTWESADTDDHNGDRWSRASDTSMAWHMPIDLPTIRMRAEYESRNNPLIEGVAETHAVDLIGSHGPTLQVQSSSTQYNRAAEKLWKTWWHECDHNGEQSGVDLLNLGVRGLWTAGEFLWQITSEGEEDDIAARVLAIHPRRLTTPADMAMSVIMGVERTKTGRPIAYHIEDRDESSPYMPWLGQHIRIPAADMIHVFRRHEPAQPRGVPLLASCLQTVADLRDYDLQVLDAARAAADHAIVLSTSNPAAKPAVFAGAASIKYNRREMTVAPPGWAPTQMKAEQPTTNYVDYRSERMRDIGRPVSMPLMMVRLDSSKHNYSSARFDAQVYHRQLAAWRAWIQRVVLARLLRVVLREAELIGLLPPAPEDFESVWLWAPMPHVDPQKEADAEARRLASLTMTLSDALAAQGKDFDEHVATLARERDALMAVGLPLPLPPTAAVAGPPEEETTEDAEEQAAAPSA